jgi:holo-[acyl-carrier protein] synthase
VIEGLGVDIVEIGRMAAALKRHPAMKERLFSDGERAYCDGRNRPEVHYALRFAAKEAVLKALGTGFSGMSFRDVEVVRDGAGRPQPVLHGRAAEAAEAMGVAEMHLSLSYTHTTAVASAVAITSRETPPPDPARIRARAFKDARSLVDDVDPESD